MPKVDLPAAFAQLQDELLVKLRASDLTDHPGTKGDEAELRWADVLNDFLPARYSAAKGFVVDVHGERSEQIDVILYDQQYSPLLFRLGDHVHIPAESVYAVFEVKPELNKGYVEYAATKALSVRRLDRTNAAVAHAGGIYDEPKPLFDILAGVLTRRAGWSPPFGDSFSEAIAEAAAISPLDIGCVLEAGTFERGEAEVVRIDELQPLMSFLLGVLEMLRPMGTVPALDIAAWKSASRPPVG